MPHPTRTLLDTTSSYDAGLLGYDAPCDPAEDGEGLKLTVEQHPQVGPIFKLVGPDGEIELYEGAARAVIDMIEGLLKFQGAAA